MKIRILVTAIPILATLVMAGCAGPLTTFNYQKPPTYTRQPEVPPLGKIGVVAAEFPPQADFKALLTNHHSAVLSGSTVKGAAIGAGVGVLAGTVALAACINPLAPATCPSVGAYVAGGAAVGAATGAVAEKAADKKTKEMELNANVKDVAASIAEALQSLHMQQSVRERVIAYGTAATNHSFVSLPSLGPTTPGERPDYSVLSNSGVDSILEVDVLDARLGHDGGAFDPKYGRLVVTAHARLIRVSDGNLLHEADYRFVSEPMFDVLWAVDNAANFKQAFDLAYQNLAEQIVDSLFLIYEPPSSVKGGNKRCIDSPLRPEYPKNPKHLFLCPSCVGTVIDWSHFFEPFPTVDSLQPELRWETFPTPDEQKADETGELSTLANVGYEVRIYEAAPVNDGWVPGPLIDSHTTAIASYRMETPLKTCGHYFWTFRAHFTLNEQPRVTEWAGVHDQGIVECFDIGRRYTPPSRMFYPFKTECPKPAK
jgi:hypothetical protein